MAARRIRRTFKGPQINSLKSDVAIIIEVPGCLKDLMGKGCVLPYRDIFRQYGPLRKEELSNGFVAVVDSGGAKDRDLRILAVGPTRKHFKFDCVFTPKDDWVNAFTDASSMMISVLNGYDVRIFTYGQTGSRKGRIH